MPGEPGNTFLSYDDNFTEMLYGSWFTAWHMHQSLAEGETVVGNLKADDLSSPLASTLEPFVNNIAYLTTCAIRATSNYWQQAFGTVHRGVIHYVANLRYTMYPAPCSFSAPSSALSWRGGRGGRRGGRTCRCRWCSRVWNSQRAKWR